MSEKNRTVDDEIQGVLNGIKNLTPNSDEYTTIVQNLDTLYKIKLEQEKVKSCHEESKRQDRLKIAGYILEGAGIVLPLVFYGIWLGQGFRFERTGDFRSKAFQNLIHFIKPKK